MKTPHPQPGNRTPQALADQGWVKAMKANDLDFKD